MSIPQSVQDLIKRFDENSTAYSAPTYKEIQSRREFITKYITINLFPPLFLQEIAIFHLEALHEKIEIR